MGWGRGVHPMPSRDRKKKEGDRQKSAGIFELRYAFGYEPPDKCRASKMHLTCTCNPHAGMRRVTQNPLITTKSSIVLPCPNAIGMARKKCG